MSKILNKFFFPGKHAGNEGYWKVFWAEENEVMNVFITKEKVEQEIEKKKLHTIKKAPGSDKL